MRGFRPSGSRRDLFCRVPAKLAGLPTAKKCWECCAVAGGHGASCIAPSNGFEAWGWYCWSGCQRDTCCESRMKGALACATSPAASIPPIPPPCTMTCVPPTMTAAGRLALADAAVAMPRHSLVTSSCVGDADSCSGHGREPCWFSRTDCSDPTSSPVDSSSQLAPSIASCALVLSSSSLLGDDPSWDSRTVVGWRREADTTTPAESSLFPPSLSFRADAYRTESYDAKVAGHSRLPRCGCAPTSPSSAFSAAAAAAAAGAVEPSGSSGLES